MEIQRFTKKPVTISAVQWDGTAKGAGPIIDWILRNNHTANYWCTHVEDCPEADGNWPSHVIKIVTLEGDHDTNKDDWIIQGVAGEFYPCKPEIFEQTYSPAS